MVDRLPIISGAHFEQSPERLKIVLPLPRHWPYLIIYSILAGMWLVMMVGGIVFALRIGFSGERYAFVFVVMILVFLYILFRFGRFLMRQWAHYLATREILFINKEELILRRPISIWGNTDVYGMEHIARIYASDQPAALAFDYGYRHIYFAEALSPDARGELARFLNEKYFPAEDDEDIGEV
jgi:hypothetical protein